MGANINKESIMSDTPTPDNGRRIPKLGVLLPYADGLITSGRFVRDFVEVVEHAGVESVWSFEHVVFGDDYQPNYPYSADGRVPADPASHVAPDPLELLAFVAACSERLLLGTGVVIAPLHSPAVLAKRVATIDVLSAGRMRLGLGIGWQKEEYDAVGVPFSDRGRRLEECVEAMRVLWAGGPSSYEGRHVSFQRVHSNPSPARNAVPILLGGNSSAAIRRAGRLADGWFPYTVSPADFAEGVELLRSSATQAGRPADSIEITVWPGSADPAREFDPEFVREYVNAGASRVIMWPQLTRPDQLGDLADQLDRYREEVLERL
jgi:probable F420-dependent oxidoreductase